MYQGKLSLLRQTHIALSLSEHPRKRAKRWSVYPSLFSTPNSPIRMSSPQEEPTTEPDRPHTHTMGQRRPKDPPMELSALRQYPHSPTLADTTHSLQGTYSEHFQSERPLPPFDPLDSPMATTDYFLSKSLPILDLSRR